MNQWNNLRKVRWVSKVEYCYGYKSLTEEQTFKYVNIDNYIYDPGTFKKDLIEEIGEENFKALEPVINYEYGYFHKWIVEYLGNVNEGLKTNIQALVETEEGKVFTVNPIKITFLS